MSVVNKMLQDLEARQTQPQAAGADYVPPVKTLYLPWVTLLLLVLIVVMLAYWMLFAEQDGKTMAAVQQADVATPTLSQGQPVDKDVQADNEPGVQQATQDTVAPVLPEKVTAQIDAEELPKEVSHVDDLSSELSQPERPEALTSNQQADEKPVAVFEITNSKQSTAQRSLKQQAQDALQSGDTAYAAGLLKQLVDLEADNLPARKKLAALLFAQKQHKSAEQLLLDGIEIHATSSELRMMLARLYSQNGDRQKAHLVLLEHNVNALQEPDYLSYRASLSDQLQQYEAARTDYRSLAEGYPDNPKWWLGLAVAEERLGNNRAAYNAYQKVTVLKQLSNEIAQFVQQRMQYLEGAR